MKRIEWVDGVKAWAIFLVVLGHAIDKGTVLKQLIYLYHMPLFFMISGITFYLSTNNSKTVVKYLMRRLINLSVPMIAFTVLSRILHPQGDMFYYYNGIWYLLHLSLILCANYIVEKLNCKRLGMLGALIGWLVAGLAQVLLIQKNYLTEAKIACEISKWFGYYLLFSWGIYIYSHIDQIHKKTEWILAGLFLVSVVITFASGMNDNVAISKIITGYTGGGVYVLSIFQAEKGILLGKVSGSCIA